jgi:putative membrane protein
MVEYYRRYKDKLILRDVLAADRTQLANERTLLSYLRTALTLFIAGVSFIRFFDSLLIEIIGWLFIPLGTWVSWIGTVRFRRMKQPLNSLLRTAENGSSASDEDN